MAALIAERSQVSIEPSHCCFFEYAEQWLETLLSSKEHLPKEKIVSEILQIQTTSAQTDATTLKQAEGLKMLHQKTRPGMILHPELVEAIDRLSTPISLSL